MKKDKSSKTPTPKSKDKIKQTNSQILLESIPTTSIKKVIQCAKDRKSMLFVGGNKEQRSVLAKQIHGICCRRVSKVGRRKIQRKASEKIVKLVTINCIHYRDKQEFQDDIDYIKKNFFVPKNYLKAEEYQMKNQGDLVPTSVFTVERESRISIETLFIDNLDSLSPDDNLLRKVASLTSYKFKAFKPLIIVYSSKKLHDWFKDPFEEIPLSPEPPVKKEETVAYNWSINSERKVFCNGKEIIKLPNLQFKLFECLYKKPGKYVKNETLEKCWDNNTKRYSKSLSDTMSKIRNKLKNGLEKKNIEIKGDIIEPKKERGKNVAYKLVT